MNDISTGDLIARIIELRIRPVITAHGGDIIFKGFDEKTRVVYVQLQGACTSCPQAMVTLKETVESFLRICLTDDIIVVNDQESGEKNK